MEKAELNRLVTVRDLTVHVIELYNQFTDVYNKLSDLAERLDELDNEIQLIIDDDVR